MRTLACLLLLALLGGCERTYHCAGYGDHLIENRPGEAGTPLCETPEGQLYEAQEDR